MSDPTPATSSPTAARVLSDAEIAGLKECLASHEAWSTAMLLSKETWNRVFATLDAAHTRASQAEQSLRDFVVDDDYRNNILEQRIAAERQARELAQAALATERHARVQAETQADWFRRELLAEHQARERDERLFTTWREETIAQRNEEQVQWAAGAKQWMEVVQTQEAQLAAERQAREKAEQDANAWFRSMENANQTASDATGRAEVAEAEIRHIVAVYHTRNPEADFGADMQRLWRVYGVRKPDTASSRAAPHEPPQGVE